MPSSERNGPTSGVVGPVARRPTSSRSPIISSRRPLFSPTSCIRRRNAASGPLHRMSAMTCYEVGFAGVALGIARRPRQLVETARTILAARKARSATRRCRPTSPGRVGMGSARATPAGAGQDLEGDLGRRQADDRHQRHPRGARPRHPQGARPTRSNAAGAITRAIRWAPLPRHSYRDPRVGSHFETVGA